MPDYGTGGLYGLVHSIRRFLDGEAWNLPGEQSSGQRDGDKPVLVFLLIDGLGDAFLQRFGPGSTLLAHRARRITSVFPSTTASAVTTVLTGLAPATHGLTGWFIRDRRFLASVAPLPMRKRNSGAVVAPDAPARLFPYCGLFRDRYRESVYINPKSIAYSAYSTRHGRGARIVPYRGLDDLIGAIETAVAALKQSSGGYIHAYYPILDLLSHLHGCAASRTVSEFARIDAAFASLLRRLSGSGTEIIVSADHGFIDSPPERSLDLARYPAAASMLTTPLHGERRAAFCEVRRGAEQDFEAYVGEALRGRAVVARSAALVAHGLFGPGPRHHRLRERVGTHTLLMEPGWTICDRIPGERGHRMLGMHGGLSPQEMWVPLIQARC